MINVISVMSLVTVTVCVLFLAVYLTKRITKPLREITQMALRLEQGDLGLASQEEIRVSVHSNDEIGILGQILRRQYGRCRCISVRFQMYWGQLHREI